MYKIIEILRSIRYLGIHDEIFLNLKMNKNVAHQKFQCIVQVARRKPVTTNTCFENSVRFQVKFNDKTQGLIKGKISQLNTVYLNKQGRNK